MINGRFLKTSLYKLRLALHIPAPMSILGINYLNVSITALLVVYVFVCLLMVLLVLMQRPKQEGLGAAFGASTTDQLFGARTTNVLQKGTVYMASLFFVLTLTLAILMQQKNKVKSIAEEKPLVEATQPETQPETPPSAELNAAATSAPVQAPTAAATPVDPVTPPAAPTETPVAPATPAEAPAVQPAAPAEAPAAPASTDPAKPESTTETDKSAPK
jgi:preprotein translocase subunit SecG